MARTRSSYILTRSAIKHARPSPTVLARRRRHSYNHRHHPTPAVQFSSPAAAAAALSPAAPAETLTESIADALLAVAATTAAVASAIETYAAPTANEGEGESATVVAAAAAAAATTGTVPTEPTTTTAAVDAVVLPAWAVQLQTQCAQLQTQVQAHAARADAKRYNVAARWGQHGAALRPLPKVVPGSRPGNLAAFKGVYPADVVLRHRDDPVGGTLCTPGRTVFFPPTQAALLALNMTQINRLAVWYNEDFGIVAHDTIETARQKFDQFTKY